MPGGTPVAAPRETRSSKRSEEEARILHMAAVLDRQELHAVWDQILKTVRRTDTDPWLSPGFMVALRAAETIGHYVTGEFFFWATDAVDRVCRAWAILVWPLGSDASHQCLFDGARRASTLRSKWLHCTLSRNGRHCFSLEWLFHDGGGIWHGNLDWHTHERSTFGIGTRFVIVV